MTDERLDVKAEAEKLKQMYEDDPRTHSYNAIVYGDLGTGKTMSLRTARRPLWVHSFDPGGTEVLRGNIKIPGWPEEYCSDKDIHLIKK